MQIFEIFPPSLINELMAKRQGLNFIIDPVDLIANFGDANRSQFFINMICGKIRLNISEPVLTTILEFKNYFEDYEILQRLKQYRP